MQQAALTTETVNRSLDWRKLRPNDIFFPAMAVLTAPDGCL